MKIKIAEGIKIEEGKHFGKIVDVVARDEPFDYLDVVVTVDNLKKNDGTPVQIKYGMPLDTTKSVRSKLGAFAAAFGIGIGEELDTEKLVGRDVEYVTTIDEKGYSRIMSIKPKK
jgi:hypothetical protein